MTSTLQILLKMAGFNHVLFPSYFMATLVLYVYLPPAKRSSSSTLKRMKNITTYKNYIEKRFLNDVNKLCERSGDIMESWQLTIWLSNFVSTVSFL